MLTRQLIARQSSLPPLPPLLRIIRSQSTKAKSPPRPEIKPTTFADKSSPRNVHERPERIRGFPPTSAGPQWTKPAAKPKVETAETAEQAFDGPSRPRLIYARQPRRELPEFRNQLPIFIGIGLLGLGVWGAFLLYATNAERLASSVMRTLQFHLRNSQDVAAALGTRVKLEEPWYVLGDPWISGSVNTMQGRIDLKFRVKGDNDAGTVFFTSIRPSQSEPWRIVRYKLKTDSGQTLRLENTIDKL